MMYPLLFILKILSCVQRWCDDSGACGEVQHIYQECRNNTSLDAGHFLKFDNIKNEIFCKIIGRGRNEKLLAEVPYIPYLDLAVVFYYVLENEMFGSGSILIRQEHLDFWEVTKEELWEYARENTRESSRCMYIKCQS